VSERFFFLFFSHSVNFEVILILIFVAVFGFLKIIPLIRNLSVQVKDWESGDRDCDF